jgi:hypothetical protein
MGNEKLIEVASHDHQYLKNHEIIMAHIISCRISSSLEIKVKPSLLEEEEPFENLEENISQVFK